MWEHNPPRTETSWEKGQVCCFMLACFTPPDRRHPELFLGWTTKNPIVAVFMMSSPRSRLYPDTMKESVYSVSVNKPRKVADNWRWRNRRCIQFMKSLTPPLRLQSGSISGNWFTPADNSKEKLRDQTSKGQYVEFQNVGGAKRPKDLVPNVPNVIYSIFYRTRCGTCQTVGWQNIERQTSNIKTLEG